MMKKRYMRQALSAFAVLAMGASVAGAAGWTPGPPLNVARNAHGAVVDPCGHIWVLGGIAHYSGPVLDSIEKLDFDGQAYATQWRLTSIVMPTARYGHAVATVNGFIYVIGGNEQPGKSTVASVWRYDILGDAWTQLADLNTARVFCRATVDRFGRIWVVGGIDHDVPPGEDPYIDTVEIFDPARSDRWVFGPPLNEARRSAGVVADRWGRLYAIGGTGDQGHIATVERVDVDPCGSDWVVLPDLIPGDLSDTVDAVVGGDGRIYVAGGWMSPGWSARALRFTPYADPERWNSWFALGQARNRLSLVLGYDDAIYAIGGDSWGYQSQNTVESHPTPMGMVGDINDDGKVNFDDIDPFVALLGG